MKAPVLTVFFLIVGLAGCNRAPAPQATTTSSEAAMATAAAPAAPRTPPLWFICDALDAPSVFVLRKDAGAARVSITEYDKQRSAEAAEMSYALGQAEGAAGSVYTPLIENQQQIGFVRAINPGMLEQPAAAYTTPFTSIGIGDRRVACRWLTRTRLVGFTARRSFAITEDDDGDLIYTAFNYDDAKTGQAVDLSNGQRSTVFSLEVRGGEETTKPEGVEFRFANRGYRYVISAPASGDGRLTVVRNGQIVQSEPLLGAQAGAGP